MDERKKKVEIYIQRQIERDKTFRISDYKNLPRIPLKDHKLCSSVVIFVLFKANISKG